MAKTTAADVLVDLQRMLQRRKGALLGPSLHNSVHATPIASINSDLPFKTFVIP